MPPGKTASSKALDKGDELEARVAQLWFWEGHYARRGIDLKRHYYPEPLVVTDIDLLAFYFSPMLQAVKTIGEVKSGTSKGAPKPLDRIIWLRGLRELVGASHAELTSTIVPSRRARELAHSLGVRAQSEQDIRRREAAARIDEVSELGSHGPAGLVDEKWAHRHCSRDRDLERAYWFLRSEVWFLDEVTAAKRLIGLYSQLGERWTPQIEDDDAKALRWLFAETVSIFTFNVVCIAAQALEGDAQLLNAQIIERLSAGVVSADAMRKIAEDVDKFVGGLLVAAKASEAVRVNAMGALHPEPPDWAHPFIDLVTRVAAEPSTARNLPRQVDLLAFERLVRRRHVPAAAVARTGLAEDATGRLIRLVAAFLRSQVAHVAAVDKALTTPVEARPQVLASEEEQGQLLTRTGELADEQGAEEPPKR